MDSETLLAILEQLAVSVANLESDRSSSTEVREIANEIDEDLREGHRQLHHSRQRLEYALRVFENELGRSHQVAHMTDIEVEKRAVEPS